MHKGWSDGARFGRACRMLVIGLCAATLPGCYRTAPLPASAPEPGTRIVAELTPSGAERMAGLIGADAVGVEGRVIETRASEWELALLRVDHRGSPSVQWSGERVAFPDGVLRGARERRLDSTRTALLVGGVTVVAAVLARAFMGAFSGGGDGGGGTVPVQ